MNFTIIIKITYKVIKTVSAGCGISIRFFSSTFIIRNSCILFQAGIFKMSIIIRIKRLTNI